MSHCGEAQVYQAQEPRIDIKRFDNGLKDARGDYECTHCPWKGSFATNAVRNHAISRHGVKANIIRVNKVVKVFKGSVGTREKERRKKQLQRLRKKVSGG